MYQIVYDNLQVGTPGHLYWVVGTYLLFPVRIVPRKEAFFAAKELSTRDNIIEYVVEYINYPHNRTKGGMGGKCGYALWS